MVIPAFNEENRIQSTLKKIITYLDKQNYKWEVLVIDDGSSDRTSEMANKWSQKSSGTVKIESVSHGGKGWAVKQGMLRASGKYKFMCDADLAMPIEKLGVFLYTISQGYDIVIGSRQKSGARRHNEPISRHIMGRVFNWSVKTMVVDGFEDTQCGFKCFSGHIADDLFGAQKITGFAFDVEILHMAIEKGLQVIEIPIDWHHQKDSKVRVHIDSFAMLRDVIRIKFSRQG